MKLTSELKKSLVTVGVAGSDRGVGSTHFAIMLAGFLSSKEHKTTALIELNSAGDFEKIRRFYEVESDNAHCFCINGVDYYQNIASEQISELFFIGYDYIIFDLGQEWKSNNNEWMRCQILCMLGGCTEWKIQKFATSIDELKTIKNRQIKYYLTAFGAHELKIRLEKQKHVEIITIPTEASPFLLHRKNLSFFERFL